VLVDNAYQTLGVARDASSQEIRSAYRRLAREFHPDVCRDPDGPERFQCITSAYHVLMAQDLREAHDQRLAQHGSFMASRPRPCQDLEKGRDEVIFISRPNQEPVEPELEVELLVDCVRCGAAGCEPGSEQMVHCAGCGGAGHVPHIQHTFDKVIYTWRPCWECQATGAKPAQPCLDCGGEGRLAGVRQLAVRWPATINGGDLLRLPGQGHAGLRGGVAGDLYIQVAVGT
jgi:molecular chaperone DnaJ